MNFFYRSVLASCIMTTLSASTPIIEVPSFLFQKKGLEIPELRTLSYDQIVDLLQFVESDDFEERCSLDQLAQLNGLFSFLALEGAASHELDEIEESVATLFMPDSSLYSYAKGTFQQDKVNVILCKNWFSKKWHHTKHFVKKHKKEILIGTIVVVAVAVVAITAVALSTAAAGAAAAGAAASKPSEPGTNEKKENEATEESLSEALQDQVTAFKESVTSEHLDPTQETHLSLEERGRMVGSLFIHKTVDALSPDGDNSELIQSNAWPHGSIDRAFSTDYALTCLDEPIDLNTLIYKVRGETALMTGYYDEAVDHFTTALVANPHQPDAYLGRGMANFQRGAYDEVAIDYAHYQAQAQTETSWSEFSYGFAHGLPAGIYDSGEGLVQFVAALSSHPIDTGKSVGSSLASLATLVHSSEWATIGATLSPELHELVTDWDNLSSYKRGELAGYAFGKNGADILLPGCAVKAVARGAGAAKNLGVICKNLKTAERTLVLEAAAEANLAGVNVSEVVVSAERTLVAAEELGLTGKEMVALQEVGMLKEVGSKGRDFFVGNSELQKSYDLFTRAEESLKMYTLGPIPEAEARHLIHQYGVRTFPKPTGVPEGYLVRITDRGAGMEYMHPSNTHISVRIMPGKLHSAFPHQQKPYVIHKKYGKAFDKYGNLVSQKSPEAHIPLDEFVFRN